ncbi:hypothetical protein YC2023_052151 [Brassica napus]
MLLSQGASGGKSCVAQICAKYKLKVNGEDGPVIFLCKEGGKDSISISNLTLFTLKMVWLQFYVLSTLELVNTVNGLDLIGWSSGKAKESQVVKGHLRLKLRAFIGWSTNCLNVDFQAVMIHTCQVFVSKSLKSIK